VPSATVGLQDDLRVDIGGIDEPLQGSAPRQGKLPLRPGQSTGVERAKEKSFQLACRRHVTRPTRFEERDETFEAELSRTKDVEEAARDRGLGDAAAQESVVERGPQPSS
jgi:hypothetical protein